MSSPKNISTRNGTTMGKPTCPSKEISLLWKELFLA